MKWRFVISCVFLGLSLAHEVKAQDMFVRPNPNNTGTAPTIGDLGLKPKAPPPQAAVPATQNTQPTPQPAIPPVVSPPIPSSQGNPSSHSVQPVAPQTAPPVQVATPTQPQQPPVQSGGAPSAQNVSTEKIGGAEIIKVSSARTPVPTGSGPNTLTINIQPGLIGAKEKADVANALGLNEQEIMGNCFYQYDALVPVGSTGGDLIPMRNTTNVRYKFSGALGDIQIFPTIACRKLRAPPYGTVFEDNGFYTVGASSISCPPGAKAAAANVTLAFQYVGDGKGNCVVQ